MSEFSVWQKKRVLVTGHTGFKGGWLTLLLSYLGAEVHGVALDPIDSPNLYTVARIKDVLATDTRLDIRDESGVKQLVNQIKPDIIFHLAAQPLVRYSYEHPLETYAVNVMGTAHVLDAIRFCKSVIAAVVVTTDKCYENHETLVPYIESDRLGGLDPYSNSKACAELVSLAYRSSYFKDKQAASIATARAGNVIGGGDWADDRLIPDVIRAYRSHQSISLRYPDAVRPWQHVLESLNGYVKLAEKLMSDGDVYAEAWNFGPDDRDAVSVREVIALIKSHIDISVDMPDASRQKHEAGLLLLDSNKSMQQLGWKPRWKLHDAIVETLDWYKAWMDGCDMHQFTAMQIKKYLHENNKMCELEVECL